MKGAFVVSGEEDLFRQIEGILINHGGRSTPDSVVQAVGDDGAHFTVFGALDAAFQADLEAGATDIRGDGSTPPALAAATSCWVECPSEEAFVRWVRIITEARTEPTWVLDGDGVLWASTTLDAGKLQL